MFQKILQILLVVFSSLLIYFGNNYLYSTSLFLLIVVFTLNKNNFSLISIIPLFFLNEILFYIFLIFSVIIGYLFYILKNNTYKRLSLICISIILLTFDYFILKNQFEFIKYSFIIMLLLLVVDCIKTIDNNQIKFNVLILCLSVINLPMIPYYFFIPIYLFLIIAECLYYKKSYYIFTSFLICIYGLAVSSNLVFISIHLFAYLCYLLNKIFFRNSKDDGLEYLFEDLNNNIANFSLFLEEFNKNTNPTEYDKRLSVSIKILIDNHCITCKERVNCYGNKKIKTYTYLKELLTKKGQINTRNIKEDLFECKYYFSMGEKALQLQKQYELTNKNNLDDYKIFGISSSIQNYFISIFEKINPLYIKLIEFKKKLIEQNIIFENFECSIIDHQHFSFKIYSVKSYNLLKILEFSKMYFKNFNLQYNINTYFISIHPKKNYTILSDSATMSLNNCQISGDNMLFKYINEVNFICALSDGMGSGYHAYQLSEQTLKMVDRITNCNISFDSSLEILNNFFKTKDLSDSFATLDLININLNNGLLSLYKLGSSTTYISRGSKIIPIYNCNLPFGINDFITKEEYQLVENDLIVLVSDGINDYISENVLCDYIETLRNESPHKIVYEILQKIYYDNGSKINDDMSCIAIKIIKN